MNIISYNLWSVRKMMDFARDIPKHGTSKAIKNLIGDQDNPDILCLDVGVRKVHFVFNPDWLSGILRQAETYQKPRRVASLVSLFDKDGIFTSPFAQWRKQKLTLKPHFKKAAFAQHNPRIDSEADKMVKEWQDNASTNNLYEDLRDFSLHILFGTLFQYDLGDQSKKLKESIDICSEHALKMALNPLGRIINLRRFAPKEFKDAVEHFTSVVEDICTPHLTRHDENSMVSSILAANGYYDEDASNAKKQDAFAQSCEEIWQLIAAGYESTASSLTWILAELSKRPELQAALRAEIKDAEIDHQNYTSALPEQKQFIEECLRLYPTLHTAVPRVAMQDSEIEGTGYKIKKGEYVLIPLTSIQTDPKWFKNPDELKPERMCPYQIQGRPKHAYMPFLAGAHICSGQHMFYQSAMSLISTLLPRLELKLEGDMPSPIYKSSIVPTHDCRLSFTAIAPEAAAVKAAPPSGVTKPHTTRPQAKAAGRCPFGHG